MRACAYKVLESSVSSELMSTRMTSGRGLGLRTPPLPVTGNMDSNIFPAEIWHLIFSLACTDDGSTGRSLSLVSTYFRDISAPFKYRSIAIIHWSQIIAFCQFFCKLPASQKKTVSLFVHYPYLFLDVDGYPSPSSTGTDQTSEQSQSEDDLESSDGSALPECNDGDDVIEALDVESLFAGNSDLESGSDRNYSDDSSRDNSDSDSVWDSEFEKSFDSEEEREILEDVEYLKAVRDGRLTSDGNTRDDNLRDAIIYGTLICKLSSTTFSRPFTPFSTKYPQLCNFWQFIGTHSSRFKCIKFCQHCLV
jgi:hypothetical protein